MAEHQKYNSAHESQKRIVYFSYSRACLPRHRAFHQQYGILMGCHCLRFVVFGIGRQVDETEKVIPSEQLTLPILPRSRRGAEKTFFLCDSASLWQIAQRKRTINVSVRSLRFTSSSSPCGSCAAFRYRSPLPT